MACRILGAEPQGVLVQRDTYFRAHQGRLKLREEEGAATHLIAYERPDLAERRESRFRIVPVADPVGLKAALASTLGVEVVVAKERRLLIWKGVRIHLDRVDGLGEFIEFEAPVCDQKGPAAAEARVDALRETLTIEAADLLAGSYCDLALAALRSAGPP